MNILYVDFETYYSKEFGFSKLTTEEYIRDPRFEVIGVAVQRNKEAPVWFSGTHDATAAFLRTFDWEDSIAVAHNAKFDMAILSWCFGIRPHKIADTLSMARAKHATEVGGSLAALSEHYGLGVKGTEVLDALGKRRLDFTPQQLQAYGEYCCNDVVLTSKLFARLLHRFPAFELSLIDLTIRMFTEPVLELDIPMLQQHLQAVRTRREELTQKVTQDPKMLRSNPQFAQLLRQYAVEPPMKTSLTTGKQTYALAKTDEGFRALLEHENEYVQALAAARLGVKSTLEETRTERFIQIAQRGALPIPLRYYAARTGRWGGDELINMQNLPRGSTLKHAIRAPAGYMFVDCDLSQIEARVLAWLAQQDDLVEAFARGDDVYKIMASAIYGKPQEEISKGERFVGKTTILGCIAEGTLVLCESGWKPIETVTLHDKLWDGEEWVCHRGLLRKGFKETWKSCGVWLTPDHRVLCGTQWKEWQYLVADENMRFRALATGAENLPSQAMLRGYEEGLVHSSPCVTATRKSTPSTNKTSKTSNPLGVMFALRNRLQELASYIGGIATYFQMTSTASDYLTVYQAAYPVATVTTTCTNPTEKGASRYSNLGGRTVESFLNTLLLWTTGKTHPEKSTGWTTTGGMNPATSGSLLALKTRRTNEKSTLYKQNLMTYDIAYAGPRNRFTVATDVGPLIVHNCGYGMGAAKFQAQLKNFGVDMPLEECERVIHVYRATYPNIPQLWKQANDALLALMQSKTAPLGLDGVLSVEGGAGIRLPNGLYIQYPNLRKVKNDEGHAELVYDMKKGRATIPNKIYGGKNIENICQALARIVVGEHMLLVAKKYKVVMTVHDAIGCVVPENEAEEGLQYVENCMRIRPQWALTLPLNCEGKVAKSYGGD